MGVKVDKTDLPISVEALIPKQSVKDNDYSI